MEMIGFEDFNIYFRKIPYYFRLFCRFCRAFCKVKIFRIIFTEVSEKC